MSQPNTLAAQRRKARHFGLQALYQWTLSGADLSDIEAEFRVDNDFRHTDGDYFTAVLRGVTSDVEALEALFAPALDRALDDLDPIERNLLRLGTFELSGTESTCPTKLLSMRLFPWQKNSGRRNLIATSMGCSIKWREISGRLNSQQSNNGAR